MDVKRVKLRGGLRHVRGQPGQLRRGGRDARCECDRDVHGRVEERQEVRVWNQRTLGWSQVRGRVVQQQEVWLRSDNVQGRVKGGREVQEQHLDHLEQEEAPLPHPLGQVPRENRLGGERGPARV